MAPRERFFRETALDVLEGRKRFPRPASAHRLATWVVEAAVAASGLGQRRERKLQTPIAEASVAEQHGRVNALYGEPRDHRTRLQLVELCEALVHLMSCCREIVRHPGMPGTTGPAKLPSVSRSRFSDWTKQSSFSIRNDQAVCSPTQL